MRQAGKIRVIKRELRQAESGKAVAAPVLEAGSERETKQVVSEWVREHQRRTDEFRRNFTRLLRDMGFTPPNMHAGRAVKA